MTNNILITSPYPIVDTTEVHCNKCNKPLFVECEIINNDTGNIYGCYVCCNCATPAALLMCDDK